jgi:hypothetical protein
MTDVEQGRWLPGRDSSLGRSWFAVWWSGRAQLFLHVEVRGAVKLVRVSDMKFDTIRSGRRMGRTTYEVSR